MKNPSFALFLFLLFFIPLFVLAKDFTVPKPTDEEVAQAILAASNQTNVRALVLYGLYGAESDYGRNVGKTENGWKDFCGRSENIKNQNCINWSLHACKPEKNNVSSVGVSGVRINRYEEILKNLRYIDAKGNADKSQIQTSSTCALGFTQVEPSTWRDVVIGLDNSKIYDPWNINDAFWVSAHYLQSIGTDKNEALKPGEFIGNKDRLALQKYWGGKHCPDELKTQCIEYSDSIEGKINKDTPLKRKLIQADLQNLLDADKEQRNNIQKQIEKSKQGQFSLNRSSTPQPPIETQKQTEAKLIKETPTITTSPNLGAIKTGSPYIFQLQAEGGKPPYAWSLYKESSPLPPGLSLNRDGRISGTPTMAGTYNFVVQVEDGANWWKLGLEQGNISTKVFSLAVEPNEEIAPTPTQSPEKKSDEKQVIPPPKEKEQTIEDKKQTEVKPKDEQHFEITTSVLVPATATVNTPYSSNSIIATGGTPPYKWSLYENSSNLPPGLSINKNGVIEGTPTQSGTYNFIVEVKDSSGGWIRGLFGAGEKTTKIFSIVVNEAPKQDPPIVSPAPTPAPPPTPQNNNFEMSMSNSITLMKGDTALQEISVTIPDGNKDDVNFTVKDNIHPSPYGYITNPDYNFIPRSCKVSCKTILNINAISPEIPVGSFHVTVGTHSTNITSSFELKIVERIPPDAPTMRATLISASQIKLDWSDNAAQDDALYIERKIESNNDYKYIHSELKRNLSSYVDPGLTPNTRYCYRIYFTNAYIPSPNYSEERCVTTLQDAPPISQGKPDLTITSLRAPTAANVGNGTPMLQDVLFTIANNGPVSAGSFRVAFYWSSDQIITVEDALVKSFFYHGLGPRESKSNIDLNIRDFTIPIPASFSPNTYYLGAIIDDQDGIIDDRGYYQTVFTGYGRVQESNETNNARVADTGPIELKVPPAPPTPTSPPDGFSYIYTLYDYRQPALGKQIFEWQKSNPNDVVDGTIFNGAQCEGNAITTIIINAPWDSGYITKDILLAGKTYSWNIIARANGVASFPSVCRSFSVQADALPLAPSHLSAVAKPIYDPLYPLTKAPFVVLTWQDNSQNELVFTVARNENGGSWSDVFQLARLGKDTSSIIDEYSVSAGKNYCYKVKARGTSGPSDYSEPACVTIP